MALLKRVTRLFAADVHAVLDQLEEPQIVLKQAIREMEEDLARQLQRCNWLRREIEAAAARAGKINTVEGDLDARLNVCFESGNEELARRVVRRRLEARQQRDSLQAEKSRLEEALAEHEAVVSTNRDRLDSLRQKAALVADDAAGAADATGREPSVDDDEVEIEFLREKQARAQS